MYLINGEHKSASIPDRLGPNDTWEYQCQRPACSHHWTPKGGKVPQECPACKSRKWSKKPQVQGE